MSPQMASHVHTVANTTDMAWCSAKSPSTWSSHLVGARGHSRNHTGVFVERNLSHLSTSHVAGVLLSGIERHCLLNNVWNEHDENVKAYRTNGQRHPPTSSIEIHRLDCGRPHASPVGEVQNVRRPRFRGHGNGNDRRRPCQNRHGYRTAGLVGTPGGCRAATEASNDLSLATEKVGSGDHHGLTRRTAGRVERRQNRIAPSTGRSGSGRCGRQSAVRQRSRRDRRGCQAGARWSGPDGDRLRCRFRAAACHLGHHQRRRDEYH